MKIYNEDSEVTKKHLRQISKDKFVEELARTCSIEELAAICRQLLEDVEFYGQPSGPGDALKCGYAF